MNNTVIETNTVPGKFIPKDFQRCTKTVMDNIADPDIRFDEEGVCNYYHRYFKNLPREVKDPEWGKKKLDEIVSKIQSAGKGKTYDCIIGVSGGVDSTYVALKVKELGFRPLVVHFDNGWNSEIAVKNIENIVQSLDFDLYTHVFDWEQYKDLQLAFFRANVVDIEAITDVAIMGVLLMLAFKFKIKCIISGYNYKTECILPQSWYYKDYFNIIDIHRKYGKRKISLFPFYDNLYNKFKLKLNPVDVFNLLDYIDYNKPQAKKEITEKLKWKDYGGKHYESVFTRFFQGYILPNKFGFDKRKSHLTNLICCGQMTRDEALKELEAPIYDINQLKTDYDFVLKKLDFTRQEFEDYINTPGQSHFSFDTEAKYWERNKFKSGLKKIIQKMTS
jgi:N-acetyl sugar amidotransferase